jgi:outer membrane lipase/esterase
MKPNVNRIARTVLGAATLAASALLASCGGGEQVERFNATRVLAFGDEYSVINTDGTKYSVNALQTGSATQIDCISNPLWVQSVASLYGLVFPQCAGTLPSVASRIYATPGATVADLAAQIDRHLQSGGFAPGDLATVFIGANDIVAQFQRFPAVGEDQLTADVTALGAGLAAQVNRLAGYGARVLIVTVPDMGLTPFAGDRSPGSVNPGVLSRLSTRFNDSLLLRVLNDGRKIGLVQLDEYLKAVDTATLRGSGSPYVNVTQPACAVALPNCTTGTLVPEAVGAAWLWADARHFGAIAQGALASLAASRASNNPF